jgi:hypothetical protein
MKVELIYCNGCSHSAGGGMELNRFVDDKSMTIREHYKTTHNVWWDSQIEVTYSNKLANLFGVECVNEAESGGGSGRVIRMAYDFIKKNWDRKDKLFLLLELPSLGRLDIWSNLLKDYFIFNLEFNNQDYSDNSVLSLFGTKKYFTETTQDDNQRLSFGLKHYHKLFFDKKDEYKKIAREINTFLTYLKYHKIKFLFFDGEFGGSIDSDIKKTNMIDIKVGNKSIHDFHEYAIQTNGTLAEETDMKFIDLHPGYFCHQNFAKDLYSYINENYEKL